MTNEVLESALEVLRTGGEAVMATLVDTLGSTPQKPGAAILVRRDDSIAGTIGGGCVEGDIWFQAREMLKAGDEFKFFSYELNESVAASDGLVCGGTMHFMLERVSGGKTAADLLQHALEAQQGKLPAFATVTIIRAPQHEQHLVAGSKLELDARDGARNERSPAAALLMERAAERAAGAAPDQSVVRVEDDPEGYAYCIQLHSAPIRLIVAGAGHVGKSIADLAHFLKLRVAVVDDRDDFANRERFPYAEEVLAGSFDDALKQLEPGPNCYVLVVTRGHKQDLTVLSSALGTAAAYIGIMGSRRKGILLLKELRARGVPAQQLKRVRTPIGLDIGATSPPEIALSILSEIMTLHSESSGRPLRINEADMAKYLPTAS